MPMLTKGVVLPVLAAVGLEDVPPGVEGELWRRFAAFVRDVLPVTMAGGSLLTEPELLGLVEKTGFIQIPQWIEPVLAIWSEIEREVSQAVDGDEGMLFVWRRRWVSDCGGIERWGRRCRVISWMEALAESYPTIIREWPEEIPPWELGIEDQRAHILVPARFRVDTGRKSDDEELMDALKERVPMKWKRPLPPWLPAPLIKGAAAISSLGEPRMYRAGLREALHQYGLPRLTEAKRKAASFMDPTIEQIDLLAVL